METSARLTAMANWVPVGLAARAKAKLLLWLTATKESVVASKIARLLGRLLVEKIALVPSALRAPIAPCEKKTEDLGSGFIAVSWLAEGFQSMIPLAIGFPPRNRTFPLDITI